MSTKVRNSVYELKRKNPITLGDDSNIETNLKPIKIDSKNSILELSESELKVRGTIDASAITVDGASVQTGDEVGSVTALNNATENELVTVGSTTTELDAEANLTFDGDDLAIAASGKIYLDGGTHSYITESTDDVLRIAAGNEIMLQLDEGNDLNTNLHSVKVGKSLFLTEQADALADVTGDGQLWVHDDAPNNLYFTDDAGNDINISRPTHTAVWGGNLARVVGSGTHFAIPTGYLAANIGLGTGSDPDTSLTCGTNADDITACVWFSLNAIKVLSCTIMVGQGGATNTGHICTLMRYDIDADGDLSNGIVVGQATAMNSDDYSQARRNTLTMTTTESELQVSTSQVLVGCVEPMLGYNTAMAAKVCIKYQEVQ